MEGKMAKKDEKKSENFDVSFLQDDTLLLFIY